MTLEPELVVHAHRGYVQAIATGGAFGVCSSCSWQGPDRQSQEQARADADAHVAQTGYRWDDTAKRMVRRGAEETGT